MLQNDYVPSNVQVVSKIQSLVRNHYKESWKDSTNEMKSSLMDRFLADLGEIYAQLMKKDLSNDFIIAFDRYYQGRDWIKDVYKSFDTNLAVNVRREFLDYTKAICTGLDCLSRLLDSKEVIEYSDYFTIPASKAESIVKTYWCRIFDKEIQEQSANIRSGIDLARQLHDDKSYVVQRYKLHLRRIINSNRKVFYVYNENISQHLTDYIQSIRFPKSVSIVRVVIPDQMDLKLVPRPVEFDPIDNEIVKYYSCLIALKSIDFTDDSKPKTPINVIALVHFYQGDPITQDNCNETAGKFGHKSGEKLKRRYNYFTVASNRRGLPEGPSKIKIQNRLNLFDQVISNLSDLSDNLPKQRAEDDLLVFKGNAKNYLD